MPIEVTDIHARQIKRRLWRNSWLAAVIVWIVSWLYQLAAGETVSWITLSKTLAGTAGVLIAASFALSGFSYYFDFLDTKLGYRKYLGLIGFYFAVLYSLFLIGLYPELYGWGLWSRLTEPEVLLGLAAMAILSLMAIISNQRLMVLLGPNLWRQILRFGYLAMIFLVTRAYLLEGDLWHTWLINMNGLPPGRLVLSIICLAVIGLRATMLVNQLWHNINNHKSFWSASNSSVKSGYINVWIFFILIGIALLFYVVYFQFSVRLVKPPLSLIVIKESKLETAGRVKLFSDPELSFLQMPTGFVIQIFASDISPSALSRPGPALGPRLMTLVDDTVLVAVPGQGIILALRDTNGDGRADWQQEFLSGLRRPHNIVKYNDWYYIATEDSIIRVQDNDHDFKAETDSQQKLVSLPTGGHWTRTVKIINGQMYIAVGSSCNVCQESHTMRAAITRCNLAGDNCSTFASGLRNTVDFVEYNNRIYGTDNGRDHLGNNLPPDEINEIIEGQNYGWPICYGQRIHDTNFDKKVYTDNPCAKTIPPLVELPAHIAPLGLEFYQGQDFPSEYRGDLFVASHGSWNRQPPDGYKIYRINWQTKEVSDFISGWLQGKLVRGRPVGIINYQGGFLISDDAAGVIYLVRYSP